MTEDQKTYCLLGAISVACSLGYDDVASNLIGSIETLNFQPLNDKETEIMLNCRELLHKAVRKEAII